MLVRDSAAANDISFILNHPAPYVFGEVDEEVQSKLDDLRPQGDVIVPNISDAIQRYSQELCHGDYWWDGAILLCQLLQDVAEDVASESAKQALLQIARTSSTRLWPFSDTIAARS